MDICREGMVDILAKKIMTRELQDRIKNTERIYGCSEGGLM